MLVGICAGILTTGCWLPQVVKSLRSRKVEHFSWIYLIAATTGIGLWFVYGIMKDDVEIWLANGLSCIAVLVLLVLKMHVTVKDAPTLDATAQATAAPIPPVEVAKVPI
jgi:MtN3 and saliva related transmembrane protein